MNTNPVVTITAIRNYLSAHKVRGMTLAFKRALYTFGMHAMLQLSTVKPL